MSRRKRWNRVNLLRVRKWARYAKFSGVIMVTVAFGFAGCAAVERVNGMVDCQQQGVLQRQEGC